MPMIKVAIVEDNASVRGGLSAILAGSPGFQCHCVCRNAEEALAKIPANPPDVVLMDINLPGRSGIDCVRGLRELLPTLQIISQIARLLVRFFNRKAPPRSAGETNLTSREEEILNLVAKGYRSKEVAESLGLSVLTVETHLRNVYGKMHVRSRAEAVAKYFTKGR